MEHIYQRFFLKVLLWIMIIPAMLISQDPPEEFQFSQSTLQAFYFFENVTLDGTPIESDDWVGVFKGDICVGARQWDISSCGGGLCDLPAMGNDGSDYTVGYMGIGDIPTFKIYDTSAGNVVNAISSSEVDPWSINGFSMNELLEAIVGCTDSNACNFNPDATESCSDCCTYIEGNICDCEGSIDLGCGCGEGGPSGCDNSCGSVLENDLCGVCGGDNSSCSDCSGIPNGDASEDMCGNCDSDPSNDCEQDCAGDWGGTALEDMCGICDSDVSNDCEQDCTGDWGGPALVDMCGICDSDVSNDCEQDCAGDWGGEAIYDNCGICVLPNDDSCPVDCAGVEGGDAFINQCGTCICNGSESADGFDCTVNDDCTQDCAGEWGGSAEIDDCGVCDGGSICNGEMNMNTAQCLSDDFNVGEYNISGFDCNGFCFGTFCFGDSTDCYGQEGADECYDCADTPFGVAEIDDCGICSEGESGHIANSDQDCNGICFGNSILDECGICFGENDDMDDFDLSCHFGCTDEDASNYYCDTIGNLCVNDYIPEYLDFQNDSTCTYNIEGKIEYYSNEIAIQNVLVKIYGSIWNQPYVIDSVITDITGHFVLPNIPIKNSDDGVNTYLYEHYYLEYSYLEDSPPPFGELQAELISEVIVGIESFQYSNSIIAADVDLNSQVNAFDATLIRRFESGIISGMNEYNIGWKFVSEMDTLEAITVSTDLSDYENILIYGIKLGDPKGYWYLEAE